MITLKQVIHDTKTNSVEATWVDADDVQAKCHSYADVQMGMFRDDAQVLGTPLDEHEALIALVEANIVPYVTPPPTIPQVVSMRQARLALLGAGLLSTVSTAIAALPSPQKETAQIEWEYAVEVQRSSGLVPAMALALGMTDAQIDNLFVVASTL